MVRHVAPTAVHTRGTPVWTSMAKPIIATTRSADADRARRQDVQAVAAEQEATRADQSGDADAGGEELEHDEGHADHEQQVGRGRAGHVVQQLVLYGQRAEHRDGHRLATRAAALPHDPRLHARQPDDELADHRGGSRSDLGAQRFVRSDGAGLQPAEHLGERRSQQVRPRRRCRRCCPMRLPGATPTRSATPAIWAAAPSARAPEGPTQTATGTVESWTARGQRRDAAVRDDRAAAVQLEHDGDGACSVRRRRSNLRRSRRGSGRAAR